MNSEQIRRKSQQVKTTDAAKDGCNLLALVVSVGVCVQLQIYAVFLALAITAIVVPPFTSYCIIRALCIVRLCH